MCNKLSLAMVILKKKPAPLKSQCLSEHLQERVRGMFARELGAVRQLTEEVPQHPANARKINTAREVRLRVRLSATWTKNRATDFTRVPGVWFFARQRTSKIYFQWENNRQITPRTQKARMFGIVYGECPHIFATEPLFILCQGHPNETAIHINKKMATA